MLQSPRLPTIIIQRVASVVVDWSSPSPDTTVQSSAHVAIMGFGWKRLVFTTVTIRRVEGASPSSPTLCYVALMLLAPFCMYRPAVLAVNRSRWSQAQLLPKLLSLRPTLFVYRDVNATQSMLLMAVDFAESRGRPD
ncbi:hypothetical protein MP228_003378 [Amoeboaphelidium protococcarum]|nr:hypothetical protein MP228_003378 [Amoeboaphelidium protococcarum]